MKKTFAYEIVAATLMTFGAVLLAFVYFPVINPVQFGMDSHQAMPVQNEMNHHQASAPISRYVFGTLASFLVLLEAWYFNRKAQRLKQDEIAGKLEQKPSV
jgi:hypothetical protein